MYTVTGLGVMSCICGVVFLCGSTLVKVQLLQAGTVVIWPQMFKSDVKPKTNKQASIHSIICEVVFANSYRFWPNEELLCIRHTYLCFISTFFEEAKMYTTICFNRGTIRELKKGIQTYTHRVIELQKERTGEPEWDPQPYPANHGVYPHHNYEHNITTNCFLK